MGCGSSKLDELPAVLLCRDRLNNISQALQHRYLLSEAHLSYIHSLQSLSLSLHHLFHHPKKVEDFEVVVEDTKSKAHHHNDNDKKKKKNNSGHLSFDDDDDDSGSHLHFHDSDDDGHLHLDDDDDGSGSESGSGQIHGGGGGMMMYNEGSQISGGGFDGSGSGSGYNPYLYKNGYGSGGGGNIHMNYMKKHVTPSVSYEQRPVGYQTQTLQFGEINSNYNNYNNTNNNYYDYFGGSGNNYGVGGYIGPSMEAQRGGYYGQSMGDQAQSMKEQEPPPPPPPPATSGWDFMNLFESIDNGYHLYRTPSRDSREVREEEGIPELEDEGEEHEVVKKVLNGPKRLVVDGGESSSISSVGEGKDGGGGGEVEEEVIGVREMESGKNVYTGRPSTSIESKPVEFEVRMVDKKVVGEEKNGGGGGGARPSFSNVFEVVKELQVQFERVANCGSEFGNVLEVGKLRYHRKNAAYQVSAKMLNVITPSLPSTSKDEGSLDVDEDVKSRSNNLSATLQKLCLWEKKLLGEVKAEEEMRVKHDRKSLKLNRLIEKGADPQKLEATRSEVRNLSTKIRIAIQIVDKISAKINKLRDEELWPQLNEFIHGLSRMWKGMLECHHIQCEAIDSARGLDSLAFPSNPSDTHLEASLQLEHDLLNWTCRFTEWISAQKGYVSALNGWLMKCILYEPEETADGIAPFSPGRAGAPPIFVICNQWNQSLDRISETSEKDLIASIRAFSTMVLQFRERDKGELRQRMTANRDIERKVKNLEKEDMKMQKKMVFASGDTDSLSLSGHVVYQSDTSSKTSLQNGLRRVFEALDRFAGDSVKAYEELLQRTEEVVQGRGRVS